VSALAAFYGTAPLQNARRYARRGRNGRARRATGVLYMISIYIQGD